MRPPCSKAWRRASLPFLASLFVASCAPPMVVRQSDESFPEVMAELQSAIERNGYTLSRVQRVDYGLSKRGFESDKYQVVFYGKPAEVTHLGEAYPELAPFLPLRITVMETEAGVELVAVNPGRLAHMYPQGDLQPVFARWQRDVVAILDDATAPRRR